jgi:hypothetical protein
MLQNRMETAALEARKPRARSRLTNGNELFATNEPIDGRSMASRRFRDILGQIVADLGGSDRLSEGQRQLARRVALMALECEKLEAKSIAGEEINLEQFGQLSDRIGRAMQRLGLKRVARDVTPDIKSYLSSRPGVK